MSENRAHHPTATPAGPDHAMTWGQLVSRLDRLEQLESAGATIDPERSRASAGSTAPAGPRPATSVVFSDELS